MGWFLNKKKEEEKKADENKKDAKVSSGKETVKAKAKKDNDNKDKTLSVKQVKDDSKVSDSKKQKNTTINKNKIAYRVLVRPLITEKATMLGTNSKYVFEVFKDANKIDIANAVEEVYGIRPISVNVVKMLGKRVRRGRTTGRRKDWKKAVVTLPKGKTIQVYEGV